MSDDKRTIYARETILTYAKRGEGEGKLGSRITDSTDAAAQVRHAIGGEPLVEHFVAIACDARQRVVARSTIAIGSIAACPVDVAQLARFAILSGGRAVIIGHNHPSGDPNPSPEDLTLTARIVKVFEILGIQVLDHVIVGEDGHFSFLDSGILLTMKQAAR